MPINRHKLEAFARFTLSRFLDEGCLQAAGALALTTLFALVPLVTAVFGVLAAFPVFTEWRDAVSGFVFRNFVPATGEAVQRYLTLFAENASKANTASRAAAGRTTIRSISLLENMRPISVREQLRRRLARAAALAGRLLRGFAER